MILRARDAAWIQVSSPSGDYALHPDAAARRAVRWCPNRADLELWTGNAGGLEIIVDGTPAGRRSARGRRLGAAHVSLDPERLRAAAAEPR